MVAEEKAGELCSMCSILGYDILPPEGFTCVYEYLKSFATAGDMYNALSTIDANTYGYYLGAYRKHMNNDPDAVELLCNCDGGHGPSHIDVLIANPPSPDHNADCPWRVNTTTVRAKLDENGKLVSYELVLTVKGKDGKYTEEVIAHTVKLGVTEENPDGDGYNYIKHEKTGLIVAYLWFDSENQPWIIPLRSEHDAPVTAAN